VVIGDQGWKGVSYVVPFDLNADGIGAFLHPTCFRKEANLKMRLMDDPENEGLQNLLACCLAEIIGRARLWFAWKSPSDYRTREPRWILNLGFPAKSLSPSALTNAYDTVAKLAVSMAFGPSAPAPRLAAQLRKRNAPLPFAEECRIELYPEIAAQLAGYIQSPYRKDGNLLLIDVGAGTLDVSTLIIHKDEASSVVSFQVCEVGNRGALRLYETRINALTEVKCESVLQDVAYYQNGSYGAPEEMASMVQEPSDELNEAFVRVSEDFREEVIEQILRCLFLFRKKQRAALDKPGVDPWGKNLRFFLTGGGARSSFYREILESGALEERLLPVTRWSYGKQERVCRQEGLRAEQLPYPKDLQNLPKELEGDFDRMSVAYGLAFGGENLMRVTAE
jgi:hypothetical protein